MDKKTRKIFSIFWLATALIWTIATVRHSMIKDDAAGTAIYAAAAIVSFVLAFAYHKNFVK